MMSMVERVARAIAVANQDEDGDGYLVLARAAIEAMREPTEAMVDAVWDREDIVEPLTLWPAMMRAALNEQAAG